MRIHLTVFFETPFWVGVFESSGEDGYRVAKITFGGSEPKEREVMTFLNERFFGISFSDPEETTEMPPAKKRNPKRIQRDIRKELEAEGSGTKSQELLKKQMQSVKSARKKRTRALKEEDSKKKFELRRLKKKEKKKGH